MPERSRDSDAAAVLDYSDETATFGDRLVLAREAAGIGQAELAHHLGVKPAMLRTWEEDGAEPRANRLQMLAGMLNVSMVWLMSGQGAAPRAVGPELPAGAAAQACLAELRRLRACESLGEWTDSLPPNPLITIGMISPSFERFTLSQGRAAADGRQDGTAGRPAARGVGLTRVAAPFHLAFAVRDLAGTREFYGGLLGCAMGRSAPTWQDFDFFGHQLSAHLAPVEDAASGRVDGRAVPIPHFGVVLGLDDWSALADRLRRLKVPFLIEPSLRFAGTRGSRARSSSAIRPGTPWSSRGFATWPRSSIRRERRRGPALPTASDPELAPGHPRDGSDPRRLRGRRDLAAPRAGEFSTHSSCSCRKTITIYIDGSRDAIVFPTQYQAIVGRIRAHHRIG